ncbi:MAG: tRNA pseudouridine(55) synthase TruB [Oscillospiraceae bacterium]|nr:tRNA pseudouridine(55) synthase TruB [Oscillospiraceae bacterium]
MNGVIVVDKPQEFTSFDIVAVMRGILHTKKVGHSGTLDPMATGILPIFIGSATKAISLLPDSNKSYRAGFRLGQTSDTLDIWGSCTEPRTVNISTEMMLQTLEQFTGDIEQIPPMYSALKVNGQKLCDLARKGIKVERKPRPVTISRLELVAFDGAEGIIDIDCSSGTYIRTLIDDIGAALGTGAVMTSLRRTRACGFTEGYTLEQLKAMSPEELQGLIKPIDEVFSEYPEIHLDERQKTLYLNGVRLDVNRLGNAPADGQLCRVYAGEFLGIAKNSADELVSVKRFTINNGE